MPLRRFSQGESLSVRQGLCDGLDKIKDSLKAKEEELQHLMKEGDDLRNQLDEVNKAVKATSEDKAYAIKSNNQTTHRSLQHQKKVHGLLKDNGNLLRAFHDAGITLPSGFERQLQ